MKYLFNFLFSVDYWPGAILSSMAVMLLEYLVLKKSNKGFPKGFEFNLCEQRFHLYNQLYFQFCVNFDHGTDFTFDKEKQTELMNFVQEEYLQESNLKYLLSSNVQRTMRLFLKKPSKTTFSVFQTQISVDYKSICKTINFSVYETAFFTKVRKIDILYILFGICNILSSIISIALGNGWFVLISVISCILAYAIYFCFLASDFQ